MRGRRAMAAMLAVLALAILGGGAALVAAMRSEPGSRLLSTALLPSGFTAQQLLVDSARHRAVALGGGSAALFDSSTGGRVRDIPAPAGTAFAGAALDLVTGRIIIVRTLVPTASGFRGHPPQSRVAVYDVASGASVASLQVGQLVDAAGLGRVTGRFYLLNTRLSTHGPPILATVLKVLDGTQGRVLRTLPIDTSPAVFPLGDATIAVDERAGRLFLISNELAFLRRSSSSTSKSRTARRVPPIPNPRTRYLYVLDLARGTQVRRQPIGVDPVTLLLDEERGRAYVATWGKLYLFDAHSGMLLRVVPLPGAYGALAEDRGAGLLFVPRSALPSGGVSVLDAVSGVMIRTVALGHGLQAPGAIAVDERSHRVFILSSKGASCAGSSGSSCCVAIPAATACLSGAVSVLDSREGTLLDTVTVGGAPNVLAVDEQAGRLMVLNQGLGPVARSIGPHLVSADRPWWTNPQGWLPWLAPQHDAAPDPQAASLSLLDAAR